MRSRTMIDRLARAIGGLLIIAGGLVTAGAAAAQPASPAPDESGDLVALVLEPAEPTEVGYLSIAAEPGVPRMTGVRLGVAQGEVEAVLVFRADALTLTNGGFGAAAAGSEPTGPTTWLDFETARHTFAPGEGIEQAVTILVPDGTAPGEYVTSLVIQTADPMPIPGQAGLTQTVRLLLPVLITVPGPLRPEIAIGEPELVARNGAVVLVAPVENTGNAIVRPGGEIALGDPDSGETIVTAPVAMGSVYPGHETSIEIVMPPTLEPGDYDVTIDLADDERGWSGYRTVVPLTAPDPAAALAPEPISFQGIAVEPDGAQPRYATVSATIVNTGEEIDAARVSLQVVRDGAPVEDYTMVEPLTVPNGMTAIEQRYVPGAGWEPGTYTFELVLEAVERDSGVRLVLARHQIDDAITVP